jgi:hypothetical protein
MIPVKGAQYNCYTVVHVLLGYQVGSGVHVRLVLFGLFLADSDLLQSKSAPFYSE